MPHSARAMKHQQCLTHRPVNKRGWVSQTRTFSDCFAEFLQASYPSKGFYIFTLYAIWPIYTRQTLPGPDPVLILSANSCVDRRTSDDSIASRGKNLCFLIFNWFYGTLLIVLVVCILKLDYSIKRFIL